METESLPSYRPLPIDEEPLLNSRYAILLPEETKVEPHHVRGITSMTFDFRTGMWNDVVISLIEMVGGELTMSKLMHYFATGQRGTIVVQLLDGVGICVNEMSIVDYEPLSITKPELTYEKQGVTMISLALRPKTISIGYGDEKVTYSSKEK